LRGFTVAPAWSTRAAVSRAASALRGAFSGRLIVDCEASGAPLRTATYRDLHQRVMPQPVEVDGILVAAGDRTNARHHHFEHLVADTGRIAPIRHRIGKPPANAEVAFRVPQEQQTPI
jgi:hypothetical protein